MTKLLTLLRTFPNARIIPSAFYPVGLLWLSASVTLAGDLAPVALPAPRVTSGKPLMQALQDRQTTRELDRRALTDQVLGDLLWAGFGVNRPGNGHRTAPSAMNSQEVDLYVARADGLFVYDAPGHRLSTVTGEDVRGRISGQAFAKEAPVVLVYVANLAKLTKAKPERKSFYAAIDVGCVVQNIYLYCASENLGTVVFDLDRPPLTEVLRLKPDQEIILAQAVGYPLK